MAIDWESLRGMDLGIGGSFGSGENYNRYGRTVNIPGLGQVQLTPTFNNLDNSIQGYSASVPRGDGTYMRVDLDARGRVGNVDNWQPSDNALINGILDYAPVIIGAMAGAGAAGYLGSGSAGAAAGTDFAVTQGLGQTAYGSTAGASTGAGAGLGQTVYTGGGTEAGSALENGVQVQPVAGNNVYQTPLNADGTTSLEGGEWWNQGGGSAQQTGGILDELVNGIPPADGGTGSVLDNLVNGIPPVEGGTGTTVPPVVNPGGGNNGNNSNTGNTASWANALRNMLGGGTNAQDLATLLAGLYSDYQTRNTANSLMDMYRPWASSATNYNQRLSDSYTNPESYFSGPEFQAIQRTTGDYLQRQDAAGGRLNNDIGRAAQLQNLAASNINQYRQTLGGITNAQAGIGTGQGSVLGNLLNGQVGSGTTGALGNILGRANSTRAA